MTPLPSLPARAVFAAACLPLLLTTIAFANSLLTPLRPIHVIAALLAAAGERDRADAVSRRVDRVRQAIEDEIAELGAFDAQDPRHMARLADAALRAADLSVGSAINVNVTQPAARPTVPRVIQVCPRCGYASG